MRKKKRVLSFLTAAALFVSSLSGSYVSVNAATVDVYSAETDADGKVQVVLPDGTYDVEVSKDGFEHTSGGNDNAKTQITVAGTEKTEELQISKKDYIPTPGKVTVEGGALVVSAPESGQEAAKTPAFTASVADQFNISMGADVYTTEWSIYPAGTTTANAAVSIDGTGIVSVTSDYTSDSQIVDYDVVCKATANGESAEGKTTIKVCTSDVIAYQVVGWEQAGGTDNRGGSKELASPIQLPALSSTTIKVQYPTGTDGNGQATIALMSGTTKVMGIQLQNKDVYAWTGWKGSNDMNQEGDKVQTGNNSGQLFGEYDKTKEFSVTFTIDNTNKQVKVSADYEGAKDVVLSLSDEVAEVTGFRFGHYRTYGAIKVQDIKVEKVNPNYIDIVGQSAFAKISGLTVKKEYGLTQAVVSAGEAFEWNVVSKETKQAVEGLTIADGILSVVDTVAAGTYTINVVSAANDKKKASLDITIADFQTVDLNIAGAGAMQVGDIGVYRITDAVDSYGDVIPDELLAAATWTSDKPEIVSVEKKAELSPGEAEATAKAAGTATVTVELNNGGKKSTKSLQITVADYYLLKDLTDGSAAITADEKTKLIHNDNVVGYQITTAKDDGTIVDSKTEKTLPDSITSQGATKAEIAPVFEYTIEKPGELGKGGFDIVVPDGTYNFKVTDNGTKDRFDVFVNDQMLINNFLQNVTLDNASMEVKDIVVKGNARIATTDYSSGKNGNMVKIKLQMVKSPSIAQRKQKVYVLGDSLVAVYYDGGGEKDPANSEDDKDCYRTGWGQVLHNYMSENVDVVDLANSGVTALGLVGTAFTQVQQSSKPGDLLVLESGYNDRTYDTEKIMKDSLTTMVTKAKELGLEVVLVSPNASAHDYKNNVQWTTFMEDVAIATDTKYIDLSQLSYDVLKGLYQTGEGEAATVDTDTMKKTFNLPVPYSMQEKEDTLHSSYRGASKWASVVAGGLLGLGYSDIINTQFKYEFTDEKGHKVVCQAVSNTSTPTGSKPQTETASVVKADIPTVGVSLETKVKADEASVYVNETFESYERKQVIAAGKTDQDPVTLGDLIFKTGSRKDGMACTAEIASGDSTNKYLSITEDQFATSARGVSITFSENAKIPLVVDVADGNNLELSMDILSYSRNVDKDPNINSIVGFGEIPELKDMGNVHFRAIIDKGSNKQYILVTDAAEKILLSKSEDLTATGFTGLNFYAPKTVISLDNLKVEQKASDIGLVTITVKDKDGNPVDGATVSITKEGADIQTVDKAALQALYNEVKDYEESEYTAETWADFAAALKNAEDVLADENATDEAIKSAFDALTLAKENLESSTPDPENPDLAAFEQYKKDQCAAADAMAQGAPAGADALITQAKNAINAVTFGTDLASSKQAVDAIIAKLKTDIENLKNSGNPSNTDAETFANYKAQKVQEAAAMAAAGDSAAVTALIENAKNAINAIAFDAGKSLADNQAAVDAIIAKLKTDVAAQRAADQKPVTPPADQTPKKNETFTSKGATYKITATGKKAAVTMTVAPNVKKANVPDTVTYKKVKFKVTAVAANACKTIKKSKIETLTIGKNVTTIGKKAFAKSSKLKTVTIGAAVTKIDNEAFSGCTKLKTITVKSTKVKTVGKNAFKNTAKNAKFTFPKKKFNDYKKKTFKNKGQNKKATYKKGK